MGHGNVITTDTWLAYLNARNEGMTRARASREFGISLRAAERFDARDTKSYDAVKAWQVWDTKLEQQAMRQITTRVGINSEARAALDDIGLFSRRYFGIILRPWQQIAAEKIVELYHSPEEEYVVINVAPGSGKTTFFLKIFSAWLTCRDRAIRGLMGSHVQRLANSNVMQLRRELERTIPIRARPKDLAQGLGIDAVATLAYDYGIFKPDNPEMWRNDTFIVSQPDDIFLTDKEPTWSAFGVDTGFLGFRYDVILWDDLYNQRTMRTAEAREGLRRTYDDVIETRLEPGGVFVLEGQRISAEDIYRYALDKPKYIETGGEEDIIDGKKYHHIVFKAHDDERCQGEHRRDSPAWPQGCLLDPQRLPYAKLRTIKAQDSQQYEVVYQQGDMDTARALVDPIWVSGGTGADGVSYPGCWDNDRDLWDIPVGVRGRHLMIASSDPSPTKFWATTCWYINLDTNFKYLMDLHREQMDAPSFLDWNHSTRTFGGLAEEWWQYSHDLGAPITHWIVEANAAQRFILQYDHFRRWSALRGVQLIPHTTNSRNKTDPDYGVWMLRQEYQHGRIRLPGKNNTYARPHSLRLVNEVTHWTPEREHLQTDDCVMSHWFMEHNLPRLTPSPSSNVRQRRPSWMANRKGRYVAV